MSKVYDYSLSEPELPILHARIIEEKEDTRPRESVYNWLLIIADLVVHKKSKGEVIRTYNLTKASLAKLFDNEYFVSLLESVKGHVKDLDYASYKGFCSELINQEVIANLSRQVGDLSTGDSIKFGSLLKDIGKQYIEKDKVGIPSLGLTIHTIARDYEVAIND